DRDWSSDVCSSDLPTVRWPPEEPRVPVGAGVEIGDRDTGEEVGHHRLHARTDTAVSTERTSGCPSSRQEAYSREAVWKHFPEGFLILALLLIAGCGGSSPTSDSNEPSALPVEDDFRIARPDGRRTRTGSSPSAARVAPTAW